MWYPQMQRLIGTVDGPSRQSLHTAAEGLGAAALIAAVTLACLWLLRRLWSLVSGSSGKSGGYYVRDRSLGGKTVFIENQPAVRREVRPGAGLGLQGPSCHQRCVSRRCSGVLCKVW